MIYSIIRARIPLNPVIPTLLPCNTSTFFTSLAQSPDQVFVNRLLGGDPHSFLVKYLVTQAADWRDLAHALAVGAGGGGVLVVGGRGATAAEHDEGDAAHNGEGGYDHADGDAGLGAFWEARAEVVAAGARSWQWRLAFVVVVAGVVILVRRWRGVGVGVRGEVELRRRHVEARNLDIEVGGPDKSLSPIVGRLAACKRSEEAMRVWGTGLALWKCQ